MRLILGVLSGLLVATGIAGAQTADDVEISVAGFQLAANGAEKAAGVTRGTGPVTIGSTTVGVFSMVGCGYFSVTIPPNSFSEDATVGWRVEITPLKVVNHDITFRLRWVRALDKGNEFSRAGDDVELTLRPGESRPLDTVPVAQTGTKTIDGRPCGTKAASLRVSAGFNEFDRRLIGADVWLVERLPNGKEQSQLQSLRGVPHQAVPFYFESVLEGTMRFDFFGKLVAEPKQGGIEIALETVRAKAVPGLDTDGYQAARWFRSTVHVKPNEIVDVALPQPDEMAGAFAKRVFSIRIRAKQIR
jgi:hypothetical protein